MSIWDKLKLQLNPVVEKQAEFKTFTPEFVAAYIKTAEDIGVSLDEAVEHLKKLDDTAT